jgi:quercetin dioxygenase-like cupin family protein
MESLIHYLTWDDCPLIKVSGEVRRRVMATRNIMIVQYKYEPRATFPEHYHPEEQIVIVIDGEIEFNVDGEMFALSHGGVLVIPSNALHSSRVIGDGPVVSINIFHPVREDLLDEVGSSDG